MAVTKEILALAVEIGDALKIMMFMCFPTESLQVQTRIVKMPAA